MGCTSSKADQEPAQQKAVPPSQVPATAAPPAPASAAPVTQPVLPTASSPRAQAAASPAARDAAPHADQEDENAGRVLSSEWNALDRPSMSIVKGHSMRRVSADSRVGFLVDPEKAPTAERSTSRQSFHSADAVSMHKIVDVFYEKVLADPALKPFFEGADVEKIKQHQAKILNAAFGGKELIYQEDPTVDLRKIHFRLIRDHGLTQEHWDLFFGHLEEALGELHSIPLETRRTALQSIRTTREQFRPLDAAEIAATGAS